MPIRTIQVLLVEDNPDDAQDVQEALAQTTNHHFILTLTDRLSEALLRLQDRSFDLVLLDLNLSDSTGIETFARLQSSAPHTPIVVLSGLDDKQVAFNAVQAGAQDYLLKGSYHESVLPRVVQYAIERKRSLETLQSAHRQLRQLLDFSPAVIYMLKVKEGKFIPCLFSENVSLLLGFSVPEALCDQWWQGQLHPDDRDRVLASMGETLAQGVTSTEYRLRHQDGSYRWVSDRRQLILDSNGQPAEISGIWTDITERKEGEATLREKQAFLEALANSTISGILVVDGQGKKVFQNQRFVELLQIPSAIADDPENDPQFDFITSRMKNPRQFVEQVRHLYDHPKLSSHDEIELDDGTFFDRYSAPVLASDGYNYGRIWTFLDITERKRAEQTLRLLSSAVEQAEESILITDAGVGSHGQKIIFVNPAFTQMTGYTSAEVVGQTPRMLQGPRTDRAVLDRLTHNLERGEIFAGEAVNYRKDGTAFDLEWQIAPIKDVKGTITHFVAIQRDITARKKGEESLRTSEELFRQVVENIHEVLWLVDAKTREKLYISPSYETVWGRTCASLYVSPHAALDYVHESDREQVRRATKGESTEGYDENYRILRPDGTVRWIHDRAFPIRDETGTIYRIVGVAEDITERKQQEEKTLRLQRLESIGMLAAGISHDLNNVLAPIGMAVSLLRDHVTVSGDLRLLDILDGCADRGTGLVKQIIGFVHGIGGEPQILQIKHLLREVGAIVSQTFPKSIVLREEGSSELWPILANPTQIHQILLNLCVNARDAMPSGGKLLLRAENCQLTAESARAIEGAAPGAWLVIHVEDTGTGIAPEVLARIWEPFFTTKEIGQGTGLGLSTVRGIVGAHHGFTTLETAVGRGTTIRIYLPAHLSDKPESETGTSILDQRGGGELILLVDDESSIRNLGETILDGAGYRVIVACDGAEAATLFAEHSSEISLVVTDLDMPLLDGETLSRSLRAQIPALKIVAMSGNADDYTKENPCDFASGFLCKPFTVAELLDEVHLALHGGVIPNRPPRASVAIPPVPSETA